MKMKNMVAALTAVAVSAVSFAAMSFSASAAVTEIPYSGPGAGAMATENNGTDLRLNIYNEWGNSVFDIDKNTAVEDNITVTFTVSGIGTNSANTNEDGSAGADYYAALCGTIGTNVVWGDANSNIELNKVPITGDGQYTVSIDLLEASGSIECLLISSNINLYNYGSSVEDCGVVFTLNSITTGTEDAPEETTAAPEETTAAPEETTAAPETTAANGTTAASTTAAAGSTTTAATTKAATSNTTNADTSDNGIAVVLAGLTAAGAVALVSRKRK